MIDPPARGAVNQPPRAEVPRDVVIDPTRDDLLLLARFRQLALFIAVVGLVGSVVGIGFAVGTGPLRFWLAAAALFLAAVVAAGAARTSVATDIRRAARVVAAAVLAAGGVLSFTILPEFPASTTVTLIVGVAFAVAFLPARESRRWVLAAAVAAVFYSAGRELGSGNDVAPGLRLARVLVGALSGELILAILWLATLSRSDLLARLQRRERAIAESPVGIVILDASRPGRPIVLVNPAFTRITGYEPAESLGRGLEMLAGAESEPELLAAIDRSLGEGRPVEVTIRHYRRDVRRLSTVSRSPRSMARPPRRPASSASSTTSPTRWPPSSSCGRPVGWTRSGCLRPVWPTTSTT
jgi:PAS domain S-box-containing protein